MSNWFTDFFGGSSDTGGDTGGGSVDYSQYDWSAPNVLEAAFGDKYTNLDPNAEATSMQMPDGSTAWSNGVVIKPNGDIMLNGEKVANQGTVDGSTPDTSWVNALGNIGKSIGTGAAGLLKGLVTDSKGNISGAKLAGLAGGILGGTGLGGSLFNTQQQPVGYTGGIPSYTATRQQVANTYDPNRRPGSRGQEYLTDVQFSKPSEVATAQANAAQQAQQMEARNKARTAEVNAAPPRQSYATGGIANLAKGTYLAGATDGMADRIPATIENKQPAKLSHGEFVIPADVVSHLGNGNSDAGAQRLYGMMDKVRKARTGTTKQGKQINPNKFMPG